MKQCTEKGDDKTKLDTTAINTYGTYMRNFCTHNIYKISKQLKEKSYFFGYIQVIKINDKAYSLATVN